MQDPSQCSLYFLGQMRKIHRPSALNDLEDSQAIFLVGSLWHRDRKHLPSDTSRTGYSKPACFGVAALHGECLSHRQDQ